MSEFLLTEFKFGEGWLLFSMNTLHWRNYQVLYLGYPCWLICVKLLCRAYGKRSFILLNFFSSSLSSYENQIIIWHNHKSTSSSLPTINDFMPKKLESNSFNYIWLITGVCVSWVKRHSKTNMWVLPEQILESCYILKQEFKKRKFSPQNVNIFWITWVAVISTK